MVSRNYPAFLKLGKTAVIILISLSTFGLAGTSPLTQIPKTPPLKPDQRETLAQSFIKDKLQFWQKRLNLQSWNIAIKLVRNSSLKPQTLGNIHWDAGSMQATIAVQSSYDYNVPLQDMLDDMEFTVVHELVHLQLSSLPRSDASRSAEEHAVNEITQALLNLARH
jgi:hypothetical protein